MRTPGTCSSTTAPRHDGTAWAWNRSMFRVTAQDLAKYLASVLDLWVVSEAEVLAARQTVKRLQAHYQKGRPGGQECVFEGLLRCRLTAHIMAAFAAHKSKLPSLLNSS